MHQHALDTAASLYESGTYTLSLAATQAGVEERRVLDRLARRGVDVDEIATGGSETAGRVAAD